MRAALSLFICQCRYAGLHILIAGTRGEDSNTDVMLPGKGHIFDVKNKRTENLGSVMFWMYSGASDRATVRSSMTSHCFTVVSATFQSILKQHIRRLRDM